jgi:hypothetical protein
LIDLEIGLEARKSFTNRASSFSQSALWAGLALHLGKVELNFRFSPGYQKKTAYAQGGWFGQMQIGISIPLFKKRYEKKPLDSKLKW